MRYSVDSNLPDFNAIVSVQINERVVILDGNNGAVIEISHAAWNGLVSTVASRREDFLNLQRDKMTKVISHEI